MDLKPTSEIEASFRAAEQRLDALLDDARACLERERIASFDDSNRTGFDGGGFPAFTWHFRFVKQENFGSEIKRATVRLRYDEPALEEEARSVAITSVAEVFQIGKQSRVREIRETAYPLEQFFDLRIEQVVGDSITAAERLLAKY